MLDVGDTHKVSPVLDWPSTLDADVASPWNQSDPSIEDRSAITGNAEAQICEELGTLVGLGPQLPIAESVPSPWTLEMPHARRVLPPGGNQQAAENPDFKAIADSRPFDVVVGWRRCFELGFGPFAPARLNTGRKCAGVALVWLAMVFALHVVCAVGPPERDGIEPKADVSSAAWEARRRY